MLRRRIASVLAIITIFSLVLSPAAYAVEEIPTVSDGPQKRTPLVSPRLIVELDSPPLAAHYRSEARAAGVSGRLDVNAPEAQSYIAQLQAEQAAFIRSLQETLAGASVATFVNELGLAEVATYQVVFNGVAIDPGAVDRAEAKARLARLPGVKAVHDDRAYETQLYTSTHLINAPIVWNSPEVGGVENAGAGVKFASLDGGVHKDALMASGEGYTFPPGFAPNGLGLTANNNGKIIVSRAYFRPWDPPAPGDENPWPGVAGTSHGMHTASTAAGNCVDDVTYLGYMVGEMCGVAPRAYIMSYRMFYASVNDNESSYTVETLAALEDIVKDGADVLQNSWGEGPITEGGQFDPVDAGLINTSAAGVFVSMSNGNSGPGLGTSDHPSPDYINVAATTTSGTLAAGQLGVPNEPTLQDLAFAGASFGAPLPIGQITEYSYLPAAAVDPTNIQGCDPWPADTFAGKAALIQRGSCEFGVKALNAEQGGAEFVIVYNHAADGDALVSMAAGAVGDQVTIPAIFVGQTNGEALVDYYTTNGADAANIELNTIAFQAGNEPDLVVSFSSRGPGVGNVLKPDIAAPGYNILAQGYAEGVTGEARHLGYGQVSGTSMAGPHVAGAATLLRQIYPDWSNAAIKSALMSTSKYMDIYNFDGSPAQPLDMGAGRLDVGAAMDPGVILNPPSLSFGLVVSGTQKTIDVQVTSVADAAETYSLSTLYTGMSFTQTTALPGFTVSPASVTLNPGETKTVQVTFDSLAGMGYGDNQGYIVMDGASHDAHMPAWARVTFAEPLADVLIIDNDFSDELGFPDYLWYYTDALDELGYTYSVISTVDGAGTPTTVPNATVLMAYKAVLLFTGDNFYPDGTFSVSTGLTQLDQDRLVEYVNSGGSLVAMGQDLASMLDTAEFDPPVGSRNFLYTYRLGANWVQDSVSGSVPPTSFILPTGTAPAALTGVVVDLTQPRDFAASAPLTGEEETPPVTTATEGGFSLNYNVDQGTLDFFVSVVPTTTEPITVTGAHIHVGAPGANGPVVRTLDQEGVLPTFVTDTLSLSGVITDLTGAEVTQMLNGEFYINVHTTRNPAGEVRGQIEPGPVPHHLYVDEIVNRFYDGSQEPDANGTSESNLASNLILRYAGPSNEFDGAVAVAHRDQVSLERPGTDYSGRSIYATFGLEGMNESINPTLGYTPTTRAELLGTFLAWTWSEPGEVTISDVSEPNESGLATFQASLAEGTAVSYRWDFGDGSAFVASASNVVGHTYTCSTDGSNTYTVRAEIGDVLGNVALGSQTIDVSAVCQPPTALDETAEPELRNRIFLPLVDQ